MALDRLTSAPTGQSRRNAEQKITSRLSSGRFDLEAGSDFLVIEEFVPALPVCPAAGSDLRPDLPPAYGRVRRLMCTAPQPWTAGIWIFPTVSR